MNDITTVNQEIVNYSQEQLDLIKTMYAKNASDSELKLMIYMSQKYNLDILSKQIWCVKFGNAAAQIYCGRDGFLQVAHSSGKFDGMETKVRKIEEPFEINITKWVNNKKICSTFKCENQFVATCTVFRIGMSHPIVVEVYEEEYSTGQSLWVSKRRTMIGKVAESQCLRKAFSISGLYSPEEMGEEPHRVTVDPDKLIEDKKMPLIDKNKIASIESLASKKGINQKSICVVYDLEEFGEMTFDIWREATEKLELRPDKIIEKKTVDDDKDPLSNF